MFDHTIFFWRAGGLGVWAFGPHTRAACDQTASMCVCKHMQKKAKSSHQHYKSSQDTLLSHFHFLHYTQIQWWDFSQPLWASGPFFNGSYWFRWHWRTWQNFFISWLLFLSVIFWLPRVGKMEFRPFLGTFRPFWRTSLLNWKKWIKLKSCILSISFFGVHFQYEKVSKLKKNWQKSSKKRHKSRVHVHMRCVCTWARAWPKCYKSTQETKPDICWKFGEVSTWYGCAMDT